MINLIIFSKNRACQLHLLLESILKNAKSLFQPININVIYTYTSEEYKKAYNKLIRHTIFNGIYFIEQGNFKEDTIKLLEFISEYSKYVCFMVDDNIIFKEISLSIEYIEDIFSREQIATISIRLGDNIEYDDWYNRKTAIKPDMVGVLEYEEGPRLLLWDWSAVYSHSNCGYPFTVDGNIYRISDIIDNLNYDFDTPNALEGRFNRNCLSKLMCGLEHSVLVNNPLNLVGSSNNNAGIYTNYTLEILNNKYLDGYKINLDLIVKNKIVACHQEMEIGFQK